MNFTHFAGIEHSEGYVFRPLSPRLVADLSRYFWKIAVPFVLVTVFYLM